MALGTVKNRQYARLNRVIRQCEPAPHHIRELAAKVQQQLGFRKPVEILVSNANYGPAAVGCLRLKLILPDKLVATWSDRLLRPVLAHELVHARRGDLVWGYLQFAAQVVWWFHPLVIRPSPKASGELQLICCARWSTT